MRACYSRQTTLRRGQFSMPNKMLARLRRRKMFLLLGLGAGVAASRLGTGQEVSAQANPAVVAISGGYTGDRDTAHTNGDGVQGYGAYYANAGVFGRNNDLNGI